MVNKVKKIEAQPIGIFEIKPFSYGESKVVTGYSVDVVVQGLDYDMLPKATLGSVHTTKYDPTTNTLLVTYIFPLGFLYTGRFFARHFQEKISRMVEEYKLSQMNQHENTK